MSYDLDAFAGLYQELGFGSFAPRRYFCNFDSTTDVAGSMFCPHDANPPIHFTPWVAECKAASAFSTSASASLETAEHSNISTSLTVAERAALLPTPSYAQVRLFTRIETVGAPNACPAPSNPQACLDDADAGLEFDVTTDFGATFPWDTAYDGDVYTEQTRSLPGGSTGVVGEDTGILGGTLIREPDELTYTGDPTNDAVETLIPWEVFIADPGMSLTAGIVGANGVWRFQRQDTFFTVRLWYEAVPVADGLICLLWSA